MDKMDHLGHFWAIFCPKMAIYEPQGAKIDPNFWKMSFLQQIILAPNSWDNVTLSFAMPQVTGMHLFEEIVKTGAIFVLQGQKWPKSAKMAIFWWGNANLHIRFSGPRCQDIIPSSLVSTHVIRMRLFDIFVKMGSIFAPWG